MTEELRKGKRRIAPAILAATAIAASGAGGFLSGKSGAKRESAWLTQSNRGLEKRTAHLRETNYALREVVRPTRTEGGAVVSGAIVDTVAQQMQLDQMRNYLQTRAKVHYETASRLLGQRGRFTKQDTQRARRISRLLGEFQSHASAMGDAGLAQHLGAARSELSRRIER